MKPKTKITSALALAKVKFLGKRIPLAVRWQLTNRCPGRCLYCNLWQIPSPELSTKQIFSILDELAQMRTKRISFSGGEPTLRDDLGKIIDYTKKLGISPIMNTNGLGILKKIKELKNLDLLQISLDGQPDVDKKVRGNKKAYGWAISAAEAAKKQGIKFTFCTTMTRYNLNSLEFMVNLAQKYKTMVAFQPLKTIYRGVKDMSALYPTKEEWTKALKELRSLKKKYPKNIRNSSLLLDHIVHWPKYKKIPCWAGKIFCIIDVNGDVIPCDRVDYPTLPFDHSTMLMASKLRASRGEAPTKKIPNAVELGFKEAFKRMPEAKCSGCGFCGAMELNFLLEGKMEVLAGLRRLLD